MKVSEILKAEGLMSKDIKLRFANSQISLNGEVLKQDIDLPVESWQDAGSFLMTICVNPIWFLQFKLLGVESFMGDTNISNELTRVLLNKAIIKFSKREFLILNYHADETPL